MSKNHKRKRRQPRGLKEPIPTTVTVHLVGDESEQAQDH